MTTIAVVGVGRMGTHVCARFVRAGHTVRAHDRRPARQAAAAEAGAQWCDAAEDAASGADVLVTVVPGPPDVARAVSDRVLAVTAPGAVWIDMSSNTPAAAAAVRERAHAHGVGTLEAAMGGGPEDAAAGRLTLFVGGEPEVLERCRPLLAAVADPDRIRHVGGPGAGYLVKLLVNLLWFGHAAATAEALLLGRRAGVDLTVLRETLADSAAGSDFIRADLPALFAGDYLPSYGLDRILAQLEAVTGCAEELGTPHGMADAVLRLHREALDRFGPVDGELLGVALLEERAGTRLRP